MQKTVLLVEDELMFREVMAEILREAGYNVIESENGQKATEALAKNHIDVVLSDVRMPVMDGLELLKHVQRLEKERPKVVLMSGYTACSNEEAVKAGAEALIKKTEISSILSILSLIRFY